MPAVPTSYPTLPPREAFLYKSPVQAQAVASVATAMIYVLGVRGRVHAPHHVDHPAGAAPLPFVTPAGVVHTVRTWVPTTARTEHLLIALRYQAALPESGDQVATVTAELHDLSGAVLDGGCVWSADNGGLALGDERAPEWGANARRWPLSWAHTGTFTNDDALATPTRPRPLYVPPGKRGDEVLVQVTTLNARVHELLVAEMYEAVIE